MRAFRLSGNPLARFIEFEARGDELRAVKCATLVLARGLIIFGFRVDEMRASPLAGSEVFPLAGCLAGFCIVETRGIELRLFPIVGVGSRGTSSVRGVVKVRTFFFAEASGCPVRGVVKVRTLLFAEASGSPVVRGDEVDLLKCTGALCTFAICECLV